MMENKLIITYLPTIDDVKTEALQLYTVKGNKSLRLAVKIIGIAILVLGIALSGVFSYEFSNASLSFLMAVLGAILLCWNDFIFPIYLARKQKKRFENNRARFMTKTIIFDEKTIELKTDRTIIKISIEKINRFEETNNFFFILISEKEYVTIPKRVINEQQQDLIKNKRFR